MAEEFGTEAIAELIRESGGINGPKISIHAAAASGDKKNVGLHLFFGTELNLLTENNETPMDAAALNNQTRTIEFLQEQTALSFARDDDGDRLIRVVGPYGNGDTTPQLEFVIEASSDFSDWEIVEAVDTNEGVGETIFEIDPDIPANFLRVAVNEIED